ncbi:hypothetical protein [Fluviicola sp.]|uniref:hypothetical protein n=1 Tax=Fluviicola sp. TaxID=1917219 RepID=UPI0031D77912
MRQKESSSGKGDNVPPTKEHVTIYFLEKGESEEAANNFFDHYDKRRWRNRAGQLIQNWKAHAWHVIFYEK